MKDLYFENISKEEILINNSKDVLYIIGNGFDLIHKIPSSYYNFKKYLEKKDMYLLEIIEFFIYRKDIWGNFEQSLAYIDRERVLMNLDDNLDSFEVLDEDDDNFSAADFFVAIEHTAEPVRKLYDELPKIFKKWIRTLKIPKNICPLANFFMKEAKYLTFNYTETLEEIYNIPKNKIFYIHGDRRVNKGSLVLGHREDSEKVFEEWYLKNKNKTRFQQKIKGKNGRIYSNSNPVYLAYFLDEWSKGNWRSQMRYDAIENTTYLIEDYYEKSAKKTEDILNKNKKYFQNLNTIKNIIIVGHSLSKVDYPYFEEILKNNDNKSDIILYISWYSEEDLKRIKKFCKIMRLEEKQIKLFQITN